MSKWYKEESERVGKSFIAVTDESGRVGFCYEPIMEELDSTNHNDQNSPSVVKAIYNFFFKKDEKQEQQRSNTPQFFQENYSIKH